MGGGGQGGCESRIEVFLENSRKKLGGGRGRVGGGGLGLGGQDGCERRIEVFVKIQKKIGGGGGRGWGWLGLGGGGVRMDVNEELKFL